MPIHWSHVCPPDAQVWTELVDLPNGDKCIQVSCDAPGEPPPPVLPAATGTEEGIIGDHRYSLDWEYKDGVLTILDLDITLSLDDEIG